MMAWNSLAATASIKHVVTAFCGDDSFDYDEGWRGYGQFWCTVQEEGEGDRVAESTMVAPIPKTECRMRIPVILQRHLHGPRF